MNISIKWLNIKKVTVTFVATSFALISSCSSTGPKSSPLTSNTEVIDVFNSPFLTPAHAHYCQASLFNDARFVREFLYEVGESDKANQYSAQVRLDPDNARSIIENVAIPKLQAKISDTGFNSDMDFVMNVRGQAETYDEKVGMLNVQLFDNNVYLNNIFFANWPNFIINKSKQQRSILTSEKGWREPVIKHFRKRMSYQVQSSELLKSKKNLSSRNREATGNTWFKMSEAAAFAILLEQQNSGWNLDYQLLLRPINCSGKKVVLKPYAFGIFAKNGEAIYTTI